MSAIRSNLYITHYSRSPAEMAQQRNTHLKHWSWDKCRCQNNEIHLSHRNCMALNTVWKFYQVNLGYNRLTATVCEILVPICNSCHEATLPQSMSINHAELWLHSLWLRVVSGGEIWLNDDAWSHCLLRAGFKCVEALGRIITRGPYPPSNAIIYMHLQL